MSAVIISSIKLVCDACAKEINPESNYQTIKGFEDDTGLNPGFWIGPVHNIKQYEELHFCDRNCLMEWIMEAVAKSDDI